MFEVGKEIEIDREFLEIAHLLHLSGEKFEVIKIFNSFVKVRIDEFNTKIVPKEHAIKKDDYYTKQKRKLKL